MLGEVTLTRIERDILLTALDGQIKGDDDLEFVPGARSEADGGRLALTELVLRDLLNWTGANTYRLTAEGLLTASALRTGVSA